MEIPPGGNFSFARVGTRLPVIRGSSMRPLWVADGDFQYTWDGAPPRWATPAERAAKRAILPAQILPPPPYTIDSDARFVQANFHQADPHTEIFQVANGVELVLEECNLKNVTAPDGAILPGGNLIHAVRIQAGDPTRGEKEFTNLLHECEACACARQYMQECLEGRRPWIKDDRGRVLHHLMKEEFRARRTNPVQAAADLVRHRAENDAVLTRWSRTLDATTESRLGRR